MAERKKIGAKGKHVEIPEGYEEVTKGVAQEGDKYCDVTTYVFWDVDKEDDIGMPFDTFDLLVRPIKKK